MILCLATVMSSFAAVVVEGSLREERTVTPGEVVSGVLRVRAEQTSEVIAVEVRDIVFDAAGDHAYAPPAQRPHSASAWANIQHDHGSIPAEESREIRWTLAVPTSTVPGSYWCALLVTPQRPPRSRALHGSGVDTVVQYALALVVNVGVPQAQLRIDDLRIDGDSFTLWASNDSAYRAAAVARVDLIDERDLRTHALPALALSIFPGIPRRFVWDASKIPSGRYVALATLDVSGATPVTVRFSLDIQ